MIKLLIFDVDGCLTDGSIIYGGTNDEYKAFNVKDGLAIASWSRLGFKSAIITGRNSKVVERRAKELHITHLHQGIKDKKAMLEEILKKENLTWENVAAIGDDLNDYNMLKSVGWSFSPNDGVDLIKKNVTTVLNTCGGKGAVREMIDLIIKKEELEERFLKLWQ
ncbi:KdsC family phosphatase [Sulfurospirillum arcachonense]|uniref:KdsC family phosphatase n=1 Tax=Sulfurospirillum arcachonense TaxID=57666 RepID=UPI00046AF406|nr:HAD-IIIA family hydrolase [Sulfurospirillum arcachonense]